MSYVYVPTMWEWIRYYTLCTLVVIGNWAWICLYLSPFTKAIFGGHDLCVLSINKEE